VGYRAPTFSVVRQTAWAIDELAELGLLYDSSVFPVAHDRYGMPDAPRTPFLARGFQHTILELPPLTWRFLGINVPAAGGGYFRLFPQFVMDEALEQMRRTTQPPVAMLYFHPWEFDPGQARLPLRWFSWLRPSGATPPGRPRLKKLLRNNGFVRAVDVARRLKAHYRALPTFSLTS